MKNKDVSGGWRRQPHRARSAAYRVADVRNRRAALCASLGLVDSPSSLRASRGWVLAQLAPAVATWSVLRSSLTAFNQDRLIARLTSLFGLLALLFACVGLGACAGLESAFDRSRPGAEDRVVRTCTWCERLTKGL